MKICKFGIVVLAVGLIVGQALAAEVVVSSSSKIVAQGQTFDLNVLIDPKGAAISAAQLNIRFNKSIVNINSIKEGNLFKQSGANTFFSGGTIDNSRGTAVNIFDTIIGHFSVSTPGTFITINATVVGPSGKALFNLSNVKVSSPDGKAVAVKVSNSSVKVGRAAAR